MSAAHYDPNLKPPEGDTELSDYDSSSEDGETASSSSHESSSISSYSSEDERAIPVPVISRVEPPTSMDIDLPTENTNVTDVTTPKEPSLAPNEFQLNDNDFDFGSRTTRSRASTKRFEEVAENDFFDSDSENEAQPDHDDEDFDEAEPIGESSSDDVIDEDDFSYDSSNRATRRVQTFRKSTRAKRKPKRNAFEDIPEDDGFVRRSERSTEKVSYIDSSESSEEEKSAPKVEITGDVIERVLDKRISQKQDENGAEIEVVEYLIKWKDWAHMHNTWESDNYLKDFHGYKRVYYYEKQLQKEQELKEEYPIEENAEDIEQANILKELEKRKQKEWTKVERIVASKEVTSEETGEEETRYFVKWKGLPYDQNTWEDPKDIEMFQDKIDSFLAREQRNFNKRNTGWRNNRPKIAELKEQPEWLDHAGKLRFYQLEGLNWLIQCWKTNTNCILADEMGLGKTIQTVSFLSYLQFGQDIPGPFLVVVPLSTVDNWIKEFRKWAPHMNVVLYIGNSTSRQIIRDYEFGNGKHMKVNAIVSTFELVLKDREMLKHYKWVYLCVDEAHRLKNCDSQLHECLSSFNTDNRLLITGTPLQNSLRELWSLLNFLHPERFPSLFDFEQKYLNLDTKENQKKIQALHAEIGPHLLRRYKKQVEKSLPSKSERILRVELSPMQKMYYKLILTRNVEQLNRSLKGGGKKASLINIVVELRKCCNHPYLFNGAEDRNRTGNELAERLIKNSGKLILLHKLLTRLKETGHRVLIFSQMVRMLDILSDYLSSQHFSYQRLDGSMGHDLRRQAMENFNAPDSKDFCFLLSTRAGGLGINLSTADTVIIYDSDWNPQNDLQAVARAHRIGQTKVVNIYRLVSQHTVEEEILERAKKKMVLDHLVIQRMDSGKKVLSDVFSNDDFASILQFSSQALFNNNKESTGEENNGNVEEDMDLDLDDILSRAEETEDTDNGPLSAAEELLSSFKVSTLKTTFDEVDNEKPKKDQNPNFWNELLPHAQEENALPLILAPRKRTVTSYAEFGQTRQQPDKNTSKPIPTTGKRNRGTLERKSSKKRRTDSDAEPLSDKEVRFFLRSLRKFANIDRVDEISVDCNLAHKTRDRLVKMIEEVFRLCEDACRVTTSNTYIDYRSVSVNASELLQRREDLSFLGKKLEKYNSPDSFRINVKIKPANFTGIVWTPKDDAMLMWGAYHHGIGNWEKIREDSELSLSSKVSSSRDDHKVKSSQLLRRLEALFRSLRHERANKEKGITTKATKSSRTRTTTKTKRNSRSTASGNSKTKGNSTTSNSKVKKPLKKRARATNKNSQEETKQEKVPEDPNAIDEQLLLKAKRLLKGSRAVIKDFRDLSGKELSKEDRIAETKRCLITIGENIEDHVSESRRGKETLRRHLWHFVAETTSTQAGDKLHGLYERLRGQFLIRAYQEHGHFIADLDPLKLKHTKFYKLKQEYKKKLDPISFGLSQDSAKELELMINGEKKKRNLEEICAALKEIYCGTVGVQYTHIYSSEKRKWIQEQLESKKMQENSPEIKKKIFLDSVRAETFGDFCGEKFDAKRFGLDGAESLIPGLEALVASAAHHAVKEIVFGMAHRGRLNVMANILQKPADLIFNEFEFGTTKQEKEAVMGSGDLKYHLGTSNNRNFDKNEIHLSLVANPSHLEVANPVVLGKVRAKQTRGPGEVDYNKALGILIHGDAAFPAQGIVSEIMELSQLEDYTVGGTIHVIINNQIGFTTVPKSARTSPYPCESAKASDMPIFHVNGDHPDKVVEVFKLALEFRQKFQEDVLIDLFCYRRHGHNELDNPRFTQPQMYKTIDNHPTLINLYGKQLINEKILTKSDFHKIVKESLSDLQNAYDNRKNVNQDSRDWLQNSWKELDGLCPSNEGKFFETAIDREDIIHILRTLKRVPSAFQVHESLKEHRFKEISEAINTGKGITWAFAEAIAFGSLMIDNFNVRISGEDSERGTFNQRHAVLHCQETGKKHVSLRHLKKTGKQGFFSPVNSPLSENGVLGFEYGYSLEDPMSLVIWEAQFGDFMNGAQVIIDQFLSAAEEKWLRMSGITLFLPHGYEGQGPDHSSARLERFLQFCNDDSDSIPESVLKAAQDINIQVANCTSPANFFHLLRRQMKRNFRKPLVIMTPKSLLTDPRCVSNINEFEAPSEFQRILVTNSDSPIVSPDNVRKVLFCSGRVYYDLLEQKEVKKNQDIIIVRIEQLAPFPYDKIAEQIQIYANAKYFWVQEEPKNQGAWTYVAPRFLTCKKELEISYIGRKPAAAPAEGVKVHHRQAKEKILTEALA